MLQRDRFASPAAAHDHCSLAALDVKAYVIKHHMIVKRLRDAEKLDVVLGRASRTACFGAVAWPALGFRFGSRSFIELAHFLTHAEFGCKLFRSGQPQVFENRDFFATEKTRDGAKIRELIRAYITMIINVLRALKSRAPL